MNAINGSMPISSKAELRDLGYEESDFPCPDCGSPLFRRINEIRLGSDEWETVDEIEDCCPHCGYTEYSVDG